MLNPVIEVASTEDGQSGSRFYRQRLIVDVQELHPEEVPGIVVDQLVGLIRGLRSPEASHGRVDEGPRLLPREGPWLDERAVDKVIVGREGAASRVA